MIGVERSQRFDGVAEQLDAHRLVGFRREDVDDAAATRDLAGGGDGVDAPVPGVQAFEDETLRGQDAPGAHDARARGDLGRRRQPRREARGAGTSSRSRSSARESPERAHALALDLGVRRDVVVRVGGQRREHGRCPGVPAEELGDARPGRAATTASAASSGTTSTTLRRVRVEREASTPRRARGRSSPSSRRGASRLRARARGRCRRARRRGAQTSARSALMRLRPLRSRDCRGRGESASERAGRPRSCSAGRRGARPSSPARCAR